MKSRRDFLRTSTLGSVAALTGTTQLRCQSPSVVDSKPTNTETGQPIILSTWDFGIEANAAAWDIINNGGHALDAVEAGVRITESDAENNSVGIGGLPDRDGHITLDACIMDHRNRCGSVAFLQNIEHPISVARKVMDETPHVMLVGEGAHQFALQHGFKKRDLLTDEAKSKYAEWLKESKYRTIINRENHDTIGMIALDQHGNLSGACTTSGMAYKLHGRVGDSPIIGAGLFVDNEVGAATATGVGEAVIRVAGSAIVVELMRQGKSPVQACEEVVQRIMAKHPDAKDLQVGFIAINKQGEYGGFSIYDGFNYALRQEGAERLVEARHLRKWEE